MISFLFLTLPGLIVAYVLFARPLLKQHFSKLYAEADGFWAKVWALCGKSATLAWASAFQGLGYCLQWIDPIATALGDPDLRQSITDYLQADPKVLGYAMMVISGITIIARLRNLFKDAS